MKPYLQPALLSPPPALDIEESEFLLLHESRLILNAAFSFEENYDLLVGNYLEFENSALSFATSSVARRHHEYHEMFELRAEMNRRAVNFLSSARLFVDQISQRVKECGGDKDEVKRRLSFEYDNSFEYRFMEALRNHVQHAGSGVHNLSIGGKWVPSSERSKKEVALQVFTQKRFLALDSTFKKTILDECPDKVDTLHATRRYLESLSAVHEHCRSSIEKSAAAARASFDRAIKKYVAFSGASPVGLTAYASSELDRPDGIPVFLDWDDVRIKLSKRNVGLANLSNYVISSAVT